MNPGDIVYIEASTGYDDIFIKGRYEIYQASKTHLWLIEDGLKIKISRDKIKKIEVVKK